MTDSRNVTEAQRWLKQALHDRDAARLNRDHGFHEHACFLAQQSAEKARAPYSVIRPSCWRRRRPHWRARSPRSSPRVDGSISCTSRHVTRTASLTPCPMTSTIDRCRIKRWETSTVSLPACSTRCPRRCRAFHTSSTSIPGRSWLGDTSFADVRTAGTYRCRRRPGGSGRPARRRRGHWRCGARA